MSKFEYVVIGVVVVLSAVVSVGVYAGWVQCNEASGVYVRGLFSMECIK